MPVTWSAEEQITIRVVGTDGCVLQLLCHARGFPWPHFQWIEDNEDINGLNGKAIVISRFFITFCIIDFGLA